MHTYKTTLVDVDASALYGALFKTKTFGDDDIIIIFMGQTASGKSQIIDTLTGEEGRRARDSLTSVTQDLAAYRILDHERYGSRIVLVDTPGFDDTKRTYEQILDWLKKTYKKRILLSGIVYVQRITEARMSATPHRNLLMFEELTGPGNAKNVVLVTTMWDILGPKINSGNKREQGLKKDYWNVMIHHGAAVERFLNDSDSAWRIVDNIVNRNDQKAVLLFQEETVDQKRPLLATAAGRVLFPDLDKLIQRQKNTMQGPVGWIDSNGSGTHSPIESPIARAVTESQSSQSYVHEDHHPKTQDPTLDHVSREDTLPMRTYKTELVQASKLGDDDIVIAFTGPTGSGKSQIIDTLTGQQGKRAADSLKSVTQDLEASRILDHEQYGSRIVLVDTPGFNDSSRSDEEILKLIGEWLKKIYERRILLSGIVYVHRITDPRMSATPHRNLLMFAELTGRKGTKGVVLATTMWDKLHPQLDDGNKREEGLKKQYWKVMIHHGAGLDRFLNTSSSAWSIVDNIVKKSGDKAVLLFQKESVDQKKCLKDTRAGEALELNLDRLVERQNKTVKKTWGLPLGILG